MFSPENILWLENILYQTKHSLKENLSFKF